MDDRELTAGVREELERDIRRAIRDVPEFPKPGIVFKDVTPLLLDASLFARTIKGLASPFLNDGITHVLAVESRGFLFGAPVALALGASLVPVRKSGKLPSRTLREPYALEYGHDALEIHDDALRGARGVLVVDDVLATGGTAGASCRLAERAGALVRACVFLLELASLNGRSALRERRVKALVQF